MPKEVQKLTDFTGGLNSSTDPQDLEVNELSQAINVDCSQKGRLRMVGRVNTDISPYQTTKTSDINVDTGIITFMHKNISAECVKMSLKTDPTVWDVTNYWSTTGPTLLANAASDTATAIGILMKSSGVSTGSGSGGDNGKGFVVLWMIKGEFADNDSIFANWQTDSDAYTETLAGSSGNWVDSGADVFVRQYKDGTSAVPGSGTALLNHPNPPVFNEGGVRGTAIDDRGFDFIFYENSEATAQIDRFVKQFNWWDENVSPVQSIAASSLDGANVECSFQVKDAMLLCDSTFSRPLLKIQWVNNDYFQTGGDNKSLYRHKKFIYEVVDCPKISALGITLGMHNSNSENPDDTNVTTGNKIILSYWRHKDESGLNTFLGGWKGEYSFGVAGLYDGDQRNLGRVETIATKVFDNESVNFQVYTALGTQIPDSLLEHATGGDDEVSYDLNTATQQPFSNTNRLTGLRYFFMPTSQDDWFKLMDVDLLKGKDEFWQIVDAEDVKDHGMPDGSMTLVHSMTADADSCSYGYYNSSNCADATYTITNTNGWAGRSGFIRTRGYYIDPIYTTIADVVASSGVTVSVPTTNASVGAHQVYAEFIDENYQQLLKSPNLTLTFADGGLGVPIIVPESDPASETIPSCHIADVLYGKHNKKTYQARFYAGNKFSYFYNLYRKHGERWSKVVAKHSWIKPLIEPIWNRMARKGSVYFNKPTGLKNLRLVLDKLKCTFPNIFEYYLVGSHSRNEGLPLDYKIQVVPLIDRDSDRPFYYRACEEVLTELTYQNGKRLQEDDGRCIYPEILMEFNDLIKMDSIENNYTVERWVYHDSLSKYSFKDSKSIGKNMFKLVGDLYTDYELFRGLGNMKYTADII